MKRLIQNKEDIEAKVESAQLAVSIKPADLTVPSSKKELVLPLTCHICGNIPMTSAVECICEEVYCFICAKKADACTACGQPLVQLRIMNRKLRMLTLDRYRFLHSCYPVDPLPAKISDADATSAPAPDEDGEEEEKPSSKDKGKSGRKSGSKAEGKVSSGKADHKHGHKHNKPDKKHENMHEHKHDDNYDGKVEHKHHKACSKFDVHKQDDKPVKPDKKESKSKKDKSKKKKRGQKQKEKREKQKAKMRVYTYDQLITHLRDECPTSRKVFICPNECIQKGDAGPCQYTKEELRTHLYEECPNQKMNCKVCSSELTRAMMKEKKHNVYDCLHHIKARRHNALNRLAKLKEEMNRIRNRRNNNRESEETISDLSAHEQHQQQQHQHVYNSQLILSYPYPNPNQSMLPVPRRLRIEEVPLFNLFPNQQQQIVYSASSRRLRRLYQLDFNSGSLA